MLEKEGVGQRSGTSPFCGLPRSQNQSKVRRSSSSTRGGRRRGAETGAATDETGASESGGAARSGDALQPAIAASSAPVRKCAARADTYQSKAAVNFHVRGG